MTEPSAAMAEGGRRVRRGFEAFAHRDFTLFWLYRFLNMAATEMLITTVGWQVYRLTGSELDLGLIGLAQFAPFAVLFPIAGLAADRFPRGRILTFCGAIQLACATAFVVLQLQGNTAFGPIMAVLIAFGVSRSFQTPVQQSIVPILVPAKDFPNAIAWVSSSAKISRVAGPALGGVMIALGEAIGIQELLVYATLAGVFVLTFACAALIRTERQVLSKERVTLASLTAGLRFVWTRQVILAAVALDLFAVLFGGAMALLPVYAKDILEVGPEGFGLLRSGYMGGAFVGALALTRWPVRRGAGVKLLLSTTVFGAAVMVFGVSTVFWISLVSLATMGWADMVSVFIRHSLVQLVVPDDMRGRVGAATGVFIGASNELGEFESGVTAHWWGTVPAVVVGGLATVGISALIAWSSPALRRVDGLDSEGLIRDYQGPHDRHGQPRRRAG